MSGNDEELLSPNTFSCSDSYLSDYGFSPISTLSANLGSNLHIRRNLVFSSNENTPLKIETADHAASTTNFGVSPNRMLKHTKLSSGSGSPSSGSRFTLSRRLSHHLSFSHKVPTDKENSSSQQLYNMDFSLMTDTEVSPSKYTISKQTCRERYPLEDQDPNSQDSGFSNASSLFSEDSKSSTTFRFAEPNGVPPRRSTATDFSPNRDMSPLSKKVTTSPRYRKALLHRMSTDSVSSDDGFGDNIALPSVGSLLMEQDENARLPADFSTLLSGQIFNLSKITESPNTSCESSVTQTSFSLRRSLTENLTPNRTVIRSSVESEFSELLEKETLKRTAQEDESVPFLKRRKPNTKLITNEKSSSWSGPATAPPTMSLRGTLFSYGFKRTCVKFQRSFSETEATIKSALQRATSDPNLIGDFSKPFVLPLKIGKHTDLKNIDCHTLAKLINGEYSDTVCSYTIIDCRYPYEFEGGHIKGAINIYTKEQMMEELNEKKWLHRSDLNGSPKRSILIFHCEFSSERGPSLSRYLRNADREKNSLEYPKLDYPEIYLLDGGYSNFFKHYEELCEPRQYLPMNDPKYAAELRALRARSKSWTCTNESRKVRGSYLKRLGI